MRRSPRCELLPPPRNLPICRPVERKKLGDAGEDEAVGEEIAAAAAGDAVGVGGELVGEAGAEDGGLDGMGIVMT